MRLDTEYTDSVSVRTLYTLSFNGCTWAVLYCGKLVVEYHVIVMDFPSLILFSYDYYVYMLTMLRLQPSGIVHDPHSVSNPC